MKKSYCFWALLLFVIFANNVKALDATVNVDDALYLRKEPSSYSDNLAAIPGGTKLNGVVMTSTKGNGCTGNWYSVTYGGKSGYVCGDYLQIDSTSSNDTGKVACFENDDPLNIWTDINKSGRLKQLSCDTELNILEKNIASNSKCSNWYKVEHDGTVGYACGTYIYNDDNPTGDNTNVGKSSVSDNIYNKNDYSSVPSGDGTIACYEDTGDLTLRSTPGGSSTGNKISCGASVKINSIKEGSGTCGYYYNITNTKNNQSGWVCGYYVNTTKLSSTAQNYYKNNEDLNDYYDSLRDLGFPDSYLPYLAEIHARHPKWVFTAEKINLNFDDVVFYESYNDRSLLEGGAFDVNYFSMDLNTYDILNDKFYDCDTEDGWYNASTEAIAFYLDPRNYLNEKYIFAFENLFYNSIHTESMVSKIMSGMGFWPTVYKGFSSNVYTDVINSSRENDISAIHIASRIKQEISGISTSDPRLGGSFTYNNKNYSGYYNFFNIKVYGENKIVNGMIYAMNNGWDNPTSAIYGGSAFIRGEYVGINQDNVYYEKFDVSTNDGNYTHQFQQNLAAVMQETNISYNSYVDFGNYLDNAINFTIPVYNNMSNYAVISPSLGNPNNYLKDLKVNNNTVSGFSYSDYEYDVTLPAGTKSINVAATKINGNASISGDGNITIGSDKKTVNVVVTAQNGRTRTYTLNITRTQASEDDIVDISTIMNKSGVKYNDKYIFGIYENTNINSLVDNVEKVSEFASASIKDKNGNTKNSGVFKTGDVVTISNSKDSVSYTVLIYGDINGDGVIDKLDYLAVLRHYYNYAKLSGVYKDAADANHDGKIDKLDYLAILRDYYGYAKISQ